MLKYLKDYTDEEIAVITPEEKQALYLLELAERGIALPSSVPAYMASPEDRDDLKPDVTVYSIGSGYSSSDWYFKNTEDAQKVADLITENAVRVDYDYRSGSDNLYYLSNKGSVSDVNINAKQVYSIDKHNQLKGEIDQYNKQKKTVESNNSRRSKILDEQAEVMKEIDDRIYEAERNVNRIAEFKTIFEQYMMMANNDRDVAVRFLLNAHYAELSEYDYDQLGKIGITVEDKEKYNESNKDE